MTASGCSSLFCPGSHLPTAVVSAYGTSAASSADRPQDPVSPASRNHPTPVAQSVDHPTRHSVPCPPNRGLARRPPRNHKQKITGHVKDRGPIDGRERAPRAHVYIELLGAFATIWGGILYPHYKQGRNHQVFTNNLSAYAQHYKSGMDSGSTTDMTIEASFRALRA
eukprot:COSAG02_NODE_284_length_25691_cov_14.733354_18_plen_167_part_00